MEAGCLGIPNLVSLFIGLDLEPPRRHISGFAFLERFSGEGECSYA